MVNKEDVAKNLLWRFFERCGAQGVTMIVSLVLAKMLDPEIYGSVAIVTIFISVMMVFVDSGFGNALIQKKDADDLDFSSVFYFNLAFSIALYVIMFAAAPFIAIFFNAPELKSVIRVLSIMLVIAGVKNVQQAYVSRNMLFKRFFFSTLGGTLGAAAVGITMAYMGLGIWAIVGQMLFNTLVDTVILWFTVKWRPIKNFSTKRLKMLFSYGWKLLLASFIDTLYNELRKLIIGKLFTKADLAQYNQGELFPKFIVTNVNSSIDSVLLPTMSKEQQEISKVKNMTRRAIKVSTYVMLPALVGIAVCADRIVLVLLSEKWLPCVPFLRIFCFTYAFYPIHTANLNAIKSIGRSDIFLILEIMKKVIGVISIISTMFISVKAMAYSLLLISVLNQIINSFPNRKLLGYSYIEQLKDMFPHIALSAVMGAIVYSISFIGLANLPTLILQIMSGVLIYVIASQLLGIESYKYILSMVKERVLKK